MYTQHTISIYFFRLKYPIKTIDLLPFTFTEIGGENRRHFMQRFGGFKQRYLLPNLTKAERKGHWVRKVDR